MRRLILWLRVRIFGEPDIGNAVKSMNKAVKKVQFAADYQATKAKNMEALAAHAVKQSELAGAKAAHCTKVAGNLSNLLCLDEAPTEAPSNA